MRRYELTDEQYARIEGLLDGKAGDVGRTALNHRAFVNPVLWIARSGAPWRDLPERFGNWNSVYRRFRRWAVKGRWQQIFEQIQQPDLDWTMIDSSVIRAHQSAAGTKKTPSQPKPSADRAAG